MDDCYDLQRDLKSVFDGHMPSRSQAEAYLQRSLTNYEVTELYGSSKPVKTYRTPEQQVEDLEWGGIDDQNW